MTNTQNHTTKFSWTETRPCNRSAEIPVVSMDADQKISRVLVHAGIAATEGRVRNKGLDGNSIEVHHSEFRPVWVDDAYGDVWIGNACVDLESCFEVARGDYKGMPRLKPEMLAAVVSVTAQVKRVPIVIHPKSEKRWAEHTGTASAPLPEIGVEVGVGRTVAAEGVAFLDTADAGLSFSLQGQIEEMAEAFDYGSRDDIVADTVLAIHEMLQYDQYTNGTALVDIVRDTPAHRAAIEQTATVVGYKLPAAHKFGNDLLTSVDDDGDLLDVNGAKIGKEIEKFVEIVTDRDESQADDEGE